jgi:D-alanyl-D-alanine carboxypeptidase
MLNIKKYLTLIFIALSLSTPSHAETNSLDHKIQSLIDEYLVTVGKNESASGVSLLIAYPANNKVIKKSFYAGKTSHLPDAKPVDSHDLFEIGSITKSYTAALILQLEAEGVLNINDSLGKWLPQFPMWKEVTLKQLLNMSSGIPSYSSNPEFMKILQNNFRLDMNNDYLLSFAKPNEPIEIGKKFDYSNTNYVLAGMVIEAATGKSYAEVLKTRIFEPLGLKNTYYPSGPNWKKINKKILPQKVHGYLYDNDSDKVLDLYDTNLTWAGPSGAIVSTTSDQMKWVKALFHGTIFPEATRKKLLQELESLISLKNAQPISQVNKNDPYGFGLGVFSMYKDNQHFWSYLGSTLAYRMFYLWKPCNEVRVVMAVNGKSGDPKSTGEAQTQNLIIKIYEEIIAAEPQLKCKKA